MFTYTKKPINIMEIYTYQSKLKQAQLVQDKLGTMHAAKEKKIVVSVPGLAGNW